MTAPLFLVLVLAGCHGDPAKPPADGANLGETGESQPAEEVCNGQDDDGDGVVDEDFPDGDNDGLADCVDPTCSVSTTVEIAASGERRCATAAPKGDPESLELWWEVGAAEGLNACPEPVVADVDSDGFSDVICSDWFDILVLSGRDGSVLGRVPLPDYLGSRLASPSLAVADLDQDGALDVVALVLVDDGSHSDDPVAAAWRLPGGEPLWVGSTHTGRRDLSGVGSVQVSDLDRDGAFEVITVGGILRGVDGELLAESPAPPGGTELAGPELAVVDLDLDGAPEIVDGWRRWSPSGSMLWDVRDSIPQPDLAWGLPTPVQADSDAAGEVLFAGTQAFYLVDTDGTLLTTLPTDEGGATPVPCVADLDGDGLSEFIYRDGGAFRAVRLDGTELWSIPATTLSPSTDGCSTFDPDADGGVEVFTNDEGELRMVRGVDGEVRWAFPLSSGTDRDRPAIADLDGDGSAELISGVSGSSDSITLRVFRHVAAGWGPAPRIWASSNWSGAGILPDGSTQPTPPEPWSAWGIWRGQPGAYYDWGADLGAELVDSCLSTCEDGGEARIAVRLFNLGPGEAEAGAALSAFGEDAEGGQVLLAAWSTTARLPAGEGTAPAWELVLTIEQARRGVTLIAAPPEGPPSPDVDCDPDNNVASWSATDCG